MFCTGTWRDGFYHGFINTVRASYKVYRHALITRGRYFHKLKLPSYTAGVLAANEYRRKKGRAEE
jgi:hypothetical protein